MKIQLNGKTHQVSEGATGFDLFEDRSIIAMRVNGQEQDLARELTEGADVEGISIESDAGLAILRHSTAHLLAQAVQELFEEAKLGIGPPVQDGFYYDFDVENPFTPEDLKKLENRMKELVGKSQRFV
ncbi:MAG: threonine--tRNA ligase, partial [Aquiluna sp.]